MAAEGSVRGRSVTAALGTTRLPLLVFGGPYSNLQATQALMAEADRLGVTPDRIVCTGDVVAYCGDPEATTAAIAGWGIHVIQGNCEEQLAAGAEDCGCGFDEGTACDRLSKGWYDFANARLSPISRQWMAQLPRTLEFDLAGLRVRVVHGGVAQINRFLFASDQVALGEELTNSGADLVIAGHCGIPFVREIAGRCWFNPGVIGMPANDGTARVWYGLVEGDPNSGGLRLSTHVLTYDHRTAVQTMRRAGHAAAYADALASGRWPSLDVLPPAEQACSGTAIAPFSHVFERSATRPGIPAT